MDWLYIFLGVLQGITEFLPISSSGHLFLLKKLLYTKELSLSFVLLVHLATLFSILFFFFKDIKLLFFDIEKQINLFFKILISLIPALIVGLFFRSFIEQSFETNLVASGFLFSGILLFSLFFIKQKQKSLEEMSFLQAFLIGLMQALAILPGFSRSALTITTGLYFGLSSRSAVFFSFLISLPVIAGSSLIDFLSQSSPLSVSINYMELSLAFFSAFFTGLFSLFFVLKAVQSHKLKLFSFYLIPLSFFVFFIL
ncbi:MAG: undecaprenyl-diphosphate phosphatase [Bdellovibrionaceae bacterium]|nr:undecaprenyl-diphosphate phosphatase [Pseudobdellovibrionaceae bacterium]